VSKLTWNIFRFHTNAFNYINKNKKSWFSSDISS